MATPGRTRDALRGLAAARDAAGSSSKLIQIPQTNLHVFAVEARAAARRAVRRHVTVLRHGVGGCSPTSPLVLLPCSSLVCPAPLLLFVVLSCSCYDGP